MSSTTACGPETSLDLPARFLGPDRVERRAKLTSYQGRRIDLEVEDGQGRSAEGRIVVYLDLVGRVEGHAGWSSDRRLSLVVDATPARLERLGRQLSKIASLPADMRSESRANERLVPQDTATVMVLADGRGFDATVVNLSRSGVMVTTTASPTVDDVVTIGDTRARIVRITRDGVAACFMRLLPIERFDVCFTL